MHSYAFIVFIFACIVCVFCNEFAEIFRTDSVTIISENLPKNSHFSYSLLLQRGNINASLIVGAPGNPNLNGELFRCTWNLADPPYCTKSSIGARIANKIGANFFGSALDGGDLVNSSAVICAPRVVTDLSVNYLPMKGYCLYLEQSGNLNDNVKDIYTFDKSVYPLTRCCYPATFAYYFYAFALGGFDVSLFHEENEDWMIFGAPGVKKFSGTSAVFSLETSKMKYSMTPKVNPVDDDNYFGYSVTSFKYTKNSKETWFLSGSPRSNILKGSVSLFQITNLHNIDVKTTFQGTEVGSYFGSVVLACDVNGDNIADVFVAAPMSKGNSWDEGIVYLYYGLKGVSFKSAVSLVGTGKSGSGKDGSRFGSAISLLGDYDLDGYDDIAISAPYEENGIGAVYIYRGSYKGLFLEQRISPSAFSVPNVVKGFGLGLSRGNDIDFNGHNDIAVGAYQTDQIFIIRSRDIIDFRATLKSLVTSISSNLASLTFDICIMTTRRSNTLKLSEVPFKIYMDSMDYRLKLEQKEEVAVPFNKPTCNNYTGQIKKFIGDIAPLELYAKLAVEQPNILAYGDTFVSLTLPFQHACGSDNVCNTGLSLNVATTMSELVLGRDNEILMTFDIKNEGEAAYKCNLNIYVPYGIELRNTPSCYKNNSVYFCTVKEVLESNSQEKRTYTFDIIDVSPYTDNLTIFAEVSSLGENMPAFKNKTNSVIPVTLQSSPYIVSKSIPENMELSMDHTGKSEVQVIHEFSVGKTGPSPLILNLQLSVPDIKHQDEAIFKLVDIKGRIGNRNELTCVPTTDIQPLNVNENVINTPINKTIMLSCKGNNPCTHYLCSGGYIENSRELAVFQVKQIVQVDLLIKEFILDLNSRDFISSVVSAVQSNYLQESVSASSAFVIFAQKVTYIPLWAYLVAGIVAIVIFLVIVFALFKCHFFNRNYKDKLEQERILDGDEAIENEIFEDEVFQRMESYEGTKSDKA